MQMQKIAFDTIQYEMNRKLQEHLNIMDYFTFLRLLYVQIHKLCYMKVAPTNLKNVLKEIFK